MYFKQGLLIAISCRPTYTVFQKISCLMFDRLITLATVDRFSNFHQVIPKEIIYMYAS